MRVLNVMSGDMIFFHHLNISWLGCIKDRRRWVISKVKNFLLNCRRLMLARPISSLWGTLMRTVTILRFVTLVSSHYDLIQGVHIMNILYYPVLLHVLYECLLLNLLIAKPNRRSSWRLCNGSIFYFKTTIIGIQHLNTDKSAKLFLA